MTSLSETTFQNKTHTFIDTARFCLNSTTRSFSQLFFSDKNYVGYCFILFVAYLSWEAACNALLAVIIGNIVARYIFKMHPHTIDIGGAGYNCALVGFYLTIFIYFHFWFGLITLCCISVLTVFLNHMLRLGFSRWGMPVLTLPAVIAIIIAYFINFYLFHMDIRSPFGVVFHPHYLLLFYIGYMTIFLLVNYPSAFLVIASTLPIMIVSFIFQVNLIYLVINVAIAIFGPLVYFTPRHRIKWIISVSSIPLCVVFYWLGQKVFWYAGMPILLLPAVLSGWIVFVIAFGKSYQLPVFPSMDAACAILKSAWKNKKKVVVLSGAGLSTLSNIPDYASGKWFDSTIPVHYYTFQSFLKSRTARKYYFDSCFKFLKLVQCAKPNSLHHQLYRLQKKNFLHCLITQNVDGLLQRAGCKDVIELHGDIQKIVCIRCGIFTSWPDSFAWKNQDVFCSNCGSFLKPAVKAYGEPLSIVAWENAMSALSETSVVLILGSRLLVRSVKQLIDFARHHHAKIIAINDTDISAHLYHQDILVLGKLEKIFPVLSKI